MKVKRFCWGVELDTAAKCLANYGLVMSVIGAIGGVLLFALPFVTQSSFYLFFALAAFLLFFNIGLFIFSNLLRKKNSANDVQGVEKIIKVGSYIIGSVQLVYLIIIIILGITLSLLWTEFMVYGSIPVAVGGLLLIFPSLLLHGIRTNSSGKIRAWIIFQFVLLGIVFSLGLLNVFTLNMFGIIGSIGYFLALMYASGIVIVHYNIVLEDENGLDPALGNVESKKTYLHKNMTDCLPPYSKIV